MGSGGSAFARAQLTLLAMGIAFCVGGAFALALFKSHDLDQAINSSPNANPNPNPNTGPNTLSRPPAPLILTLFLTLIRLPI